MSDTPKVTAIAPWFGSNRSCAAEVGKLLVGFTPPVPVVVTWVHVGPEMDTDNLAIAFKGLRDELSRGYLRVDDADPRVTWAYEQRPGKPGVELRIEGGG